MPESSSTGSTPVKVENPNQFAPQGANPKEYKQKFKEIKKEYYEEKIDAGPQSRILEGVTWEEAERMKVGGGVCHVTWEEAERLNVGGVGVGADVTWKEAERMKVTFQI